MNDYTVNVTIQAQTDADRARVQSMLDSGLKELNGIASRYGFTITSSSATIED